MRRHSAIANEIEILSYIFQHYCCPEDLYSPLQQQKLLPELQREGYSEEDIFRAFDWITLLGIQQADNDATNVIKQNSIRIFTQEEIAKLGIECINFITSLTQNGILETYNSEILINQLMQLQRDNISLAEAKWVAYMVLSGHVKAKKNLGSLNDEIEKFYLLISANRSC